MGLRARICFELSRKLLPPASKRTVDFKAYEAWRAESLSRSWAAFADSDAYGKDVLDFGCGDGQLSLFLATTKQPRSVIGVDLDQAAIGRARASQSRTPIPAGVDLEFRQGSPDRLPLPDKSVDTLVAFDCLEHVMSPLPIFKEWHRVLRPGGKCLIEWFPYKGPWGPHMESLIPIPWAHVVFGQTAMFRAAEAIYDLPEFVPRHWDLEANGEKKPNKWRAWSSFKDQGYINELDLSRFRATATKAGLKIARLDKHSFGGSRARRAIGNVLMKTPAIGEYFLSFAVIELVRPST